MNAVSVTVAAICWLNVVCPCHCLYFCRRCLPPPLPLLAANVIGKGGDCGNGCGGNGGSGKDGAFRSFSGVMFKILHIKSNILNIKLDEEGGGRRMDVATAVTTRATTTTRARQWKMRRWLQRQWRWRQFVIMATRATKRLRQKEQGAGDSGLRPRRRWQWRPQPTVATAGAGNGGQSRCSARADNNQPKSGSNSSRNGAGGGENGGSRGSGSGNGDSMVTVAMVETKRQPWQQ
jgi:hypothetical protein